MVRDGCIYSVPLIAAGLLLGRLTRPAWSVLREDFDVRPSQT
jgi:hypothetical protein